MAKPRMTNEHKAWVRDALVSVLSNGNHPMMSHDDAVTVVTIGSIPMYVDVCRRIVKNCPSYAERHVMETPDDWITETAKAFGEWIAYKAGVRKEEAAKTTPDDVQTAGPNGTDDNTPFEDSPEFDDSDIPWHGNDDND